MGEKVSKRRERKMSREEHVRRITPLDEAVLADLDWERQSISAAIHTIQESAIVLADAGFKLNAYEAVQLGTALELRDIRKCSNSICQFLGIVSDLADNIADDLARIRKLRTEFKTRQLKLLEQEDAIRKEAERKAAKAEYAQRHRDAVKAAAEQ